MKKSDLITIALLMANVIGISLIMASGQFAKAPPDISNQAAQPILISPTPHPTIKPTPTPSPTMVLAINKDATLLYTPVNTRNPIANDPAPGRTVEPTPTPTHAPTVNMRDPIANGSAPGRIVEPTPTPTHAPKLKTKITSVPTKLAKPTIKPSATTTMKYNVDKKHGKKTHNR